MDGTFQKIPFLRVALALATGIILGSFYTLPGILLLVILLFLLVLLVFLNKNFGYQNRHAYGIFIHLFFIFLGALSYGQYNVKPVFHNQGFFLATVLETPQEKQNSYKSLVKIEQVHIDGRVLSANEKLLVYFSKEEKVYNIHPGTIILFQSQPQFIENYGNPFEFDYKKYLQRKRIYRQVYLNGPSWKITPYSKNSIPVYAEKIRDRLLKVYRNQKLGDKETEILSALTLGYKRNLDQETKRVFSAAGAMHVLAVSGLHVGIIYLVFTFFFGFLRKQTGGLFIFVVSVLFLLWSYAFITGLSPSVLRAATMFSILAIGENLKRKPNIYNSLASSAVILLLINPNNLFEIGFQLSYSAVFGIVFLQPRFVKILNLKNKILKFFWSLLTVSLAAQIATFPITAFNFHQFPTFFWISNLFIIPTAFVLMYAGIALLLFSKSALLSGVISSIIRGMIKSAYFLLQSIESLPYSVIEFRVQVPELIFIIVTLFSLLLFLKHRRPKYIKTALLFLFFLTVSSLLMNADRNSTHHVIKYNNPTNITLNLVAGKKSYVISEQAIRPGNRILIPINTIKTHLGTDEPIFLTQDDSYEDRFILLNNKIIFFLGKSIAIHNEKKQHITPIRPDFIIKKSDYGALALSDYKRICDGSFARNDSIISRIEVNCNHNAFHMKW